MAGACEKCGGGHDKMAQSMIKVSVCCNSDQSWETFHVMEESLGIHIAIGGTTNIKRVRKMKVMIAAADSSILVTPSLSR